MKTRKYKDNQQRKNFAKSESNLLLIQYFKKMNGINILSDDKMKNISWVQNASDQKTMQISQYKKWDDFKYPATLASFFLDRPVLKSQYMLKELDSRYEASSLQGPGVKESLIKNWALKVCYSKKTNQEENKSRIRGRCIQSNRPRSVSRLLRLSRIRTRTLALDGKITGCTRSTW